MMARFTVFAVALILGLHWRGVPTFAVLVFALCGVVHGKGSSGGVCTCSAGTGAGFCLGSLHVSVSVVYELHPGCLGSFGAF